MWVFAPSRANAREASCCSIGSSGSARMFEAWVLRSSMTPSKNLCAETDRSASAGELLGRPVYPLLLLLVHDIRPNLLSKPSRRAALPRPFKRQEGAGPNGPAPSFACS
jgi:hypothetical protein